MAYLLKADGQQIEIPDSELMSLEKLQAAIGGYIVILKSRGHAVLIGDEDAIPKNLPLNTVATILAEYDVYGDVLYAPKEVLEGN